MKKLISLICLLLILCMSVGSAAADEGVTGTIVPGYTTPPQSEDSFSLGTAQVDDSGGYIILAEIPVTLTVLVDSGSDGVEVELPAIITLAQKKGTTRLTTMVEVQPESLGDTPLISGISVSQRFSDQTEFELPDCTDSFTIASSPASGYVAGVNTTPCAFVPGHTIMAIITITDIQLENGTWSGGPISVSRSVPLT